MAWKIFNYIFLKLLNLQKLNNLSNIIWIYYAPEYNILKVSQSSLGYKHKLETKQKISLLKKGSSHTIETKKTISINRIGSNSSFYGKNHTLETKIKLKEIALQMGRQ
jgi:group I intron endonuclease